MELDNLKVHIDATVVDVLRKIDALPLLKTVFVVDDGGVVVGSITDGDIRRGLIMGVDLNAPLESFMHKEFNYLSEDDFDFSQVEELREKRLTAVPWLDRDGRLVKIIDFSKTKSLLPVDAIIMAGGLGSRLKPLTDDTPKPLLKVGGKEIISYNFDRLSQFGISNQFITVNYLAEQIEAFCASYNDEINFHLVRETAFLGTAGSMSLVPPEKFKNETLLLMNSDLLTNIDYEAFYRYFINSGADMLVAAIPYKVNIPYAILDTEENVVKGFKEKPRYSYNANAGIYLMKKEVLNLIKKDSVYNATDLMEDLIAQGGKLCYYSMPNYWLDIGKHEDFEQAQKDILTIKLK